MHNRLIFDRLAQRLAQPLPAQTAHARMSSSARVQNLGFNWQPNEKTRQSAVLILLYPHENNIYFPLTLRHVYKGAHSGQVSLPGGRYEEFDTSLEATALRETHEEIGVPPQQLQIIGRLSELFVAASNFNIQPFVGIAPSQPQFMPDVREVAQLFETNVAHLTDNSRIKETSIKVGEGIKIKAPYFDLNDQIVWGATAMILSELATVWSEIQ